MSAGETDDPWGAAWQPDAPVTPRQQRIIDEREAIDAADPQDADIAEDAHTRHQLNRWDP